MGITYHPSVGEALWCEFAGVEPEMVKRRLVVVVSPKSVQRAHLVTVVPLSTTPPAPARPWHYMLDRDPLPGSAPGTEVWAKCDMIAVVGFHRLTGYYSRFRGKREYRKLQVSAADVLGIRKAILHGLGLGSLADSLQ